MFGNHASHVALFIVGGMIVMSHPAHADLSQELVPKFAEPPNEFTTAPFWVWNDYMTEDQVRFALRDYAQKGIRQVFVTHGRD